MTVQLCGSQPSGFVRRDFFFANIILLTQVPPEYTCKITCKQSMSRTVSRRMHFRELAGLSWLNIEIAKAAGQTCQSHT